MPLIRKHGGVAFASQVLSRLYGPVWVFTFFTANPMVYTVRPLAHTIIITLCWLRTGMEPCRSTHIRYSST